MKILVVNDDGYTDGLEILVRAASKYGLVYVATPYTQQSAKSHSITISNKIKFEQINPTIPGSEGSIYVHGTPADCVRVGRKFFNSHFDLVLSGINLGLNMATDILYSGTVAAAREAAVVNIPAIAISALHFNIETLDQNVVYVLDHLISNEVYKKAQLLNVNLPACNDIAGLRYTQQGSKHTHPEYTKLETNVYKTVFSTMIYEELNDTDVSADLEKYISITPLIVNQTNYKLLEELKKTLK